MEIGLATARPRKAGAAPAAKRGRAWAPALTVLVALCVTWLEFGVRPDEIARFLLFEAAFCVVPGVLVYRSLSGGRPSRLEELAFGAALGHGLVVLAFAATAALGQRWLLLAYPLATIAFALAASRRHREGSPAERRPGAWSWPVSVLCLLLLAYLAAAYLVDYPLPRDAISPSYFLDAAFNLGISAEALHHWPMTDPHVAGEPLPYHVFANLLTAAVAQLTGLDLSLVAFRFFVPTLAVLLVLVLVVAGRLLTASAPAAVAAAALFLFVGEVDLGSAPIPFLNSVFFSLYESPSFLFGCIAWVPLLASLALQLQKDQATARGWILLAIFAVTASGSKASLLPVLALGLGVFLVVRLVRTHAVDRRALTALALTGLVFAVSYAVIYAGGASGLEVRPFAVFDGMSAVRDARDALGGPPGLAAILGAILGTAGFCGPALAGLIGLVAVRPAPSATRQLLASVLASGALMWLVADSYTKNQNWFAYPALIAGCILAAEGLMLLWSRRSAADGRMRAALAMAAGAIALGALNSPIDFLPRLAERVRSGGVLYPQDQPLNRGITPGLARGFRWLREHADRRRLTAINVQHLDRTRRGPAYWYLSAFAEQRVFLEGWGYTAESNRLGFERVLRGEVQPHARRLTVNRAVFERADRQALGELGRLGVGYLVVDRAHGTASPRLRDLARPVYANPDVEVFEVRRGSRPRPRGGS